MKLIPWILRLYPLAWRQRYGDEMVTVLEQHRITLATIFDLFLGALDARLDPHYKSVKSLFTPHSLSVNILSLVLLLAVSTSTLFMWHSVSLPSVALYTVIDHGATREIVYIRDATWIDLGFLSNKIAVYAVYSTLFLVMLANLFFTGRILRNTMPQTRKRSMLLACVCLFLPLLLLPQSGRIFLMLLLHISDTSIFPSLFAVMVLVTVGSGLFIGIMKVQQAVRMHQRGLLLLALAAILLPGLSFFSSFVIGGVAIPGWVYPPSHAYHWLQECLTDLTGALLLFVGFGSLVLAVGTEELEKPFLRHVQRYACVQGALIGVSLVTTIVWNLQNAFSLPNTFQLLHLRGISDRYELQIFFSLSFFVMLLVICIGIMLLRGQRALSVPLPASEPPIPQVM